MISVHVCGDFGRQCFTLAAARILATLQCSDLNEPPCLPFTTCARGMGSWMAPALGVRGDQPTLPPYMVPASPNFMTQSVNGFCNLTIFSGLRNADFYLPHRRMLRDCLVDYFKIAHPCSADDVFLVDSALQASSSPSRLDFALREFPFLSPTALLNHCRAVGMAQQRTTLVLKPGCAAFASHYSKHFGKVIVAGPLEQLHIALHARKLAAFLNSEHWWACFLTNAEETHVFYDPRFRGG